MQEQQSAELKKTNIRTAFLLGGLAITSLIMACIGIANVLAINS